MEKKLTKKDYFTEMKGIFAELERPELVAFCEHEIDLLSRKHSATPKVNEENVKVADMLVVELGKMEKPVTITELMSCSTAIKEYVLENGKPLSNQKISYLFSELVKNGVIVSTKDKKRTVFSVK